jgi:hypothetical protein
MHVGGNTPAEGVDFLFENTADDEFIPFDGRPRGVKKVQRNNGTEAQRGKAA